MNIRFAVVFFVAFLACSAGRTSRPQRQPADHYLILAAELKDSPQSDLHEAIRQLRPTWFTSGARNLGRGEATILVYLDDQPIGNATVLSRFSTTSVASVRYISATEAQVRYGPSNGNRPAILLESARD